MGLALFLSLLLSCVSPPQPISGVQKITALNTFAIGAPAQKATWTITPRIRICATTGISILRVDRAVKYWEMLGYDFDGIYMDHNINCMEPQYGEIIITLPEGDMSDHHMAATRIYTKKSTDHIAKAKIFMRPKESRRQRVVEHEIGHALGWMHYEQKYHIMHSNWFFGGFDAKGLRK